PLHAVLIIVTLGTLWKTMIFYSTAEQFAQLAFGAPTPQCARPPQRRACAPTSVCRGIDVWGQTQRAPSLKPAGRALFKTGAARSHDRAAASLLVGVDRDGTLGKRNHLAIAHSLDAQQVDTGRRLASRGSSTFPAHRPDPHLRRCHHTAPRLRY